MTKDYFCKIRDKEIYLEGHADILTIENFLEEQISFQDEEIDQFFKAVDELRKERERIKGLK